MDSRPLGKKYFKRICFKTNQGFQLSAFPALPGKCSLCLYHAGQQAYSLHTSSLLTLLYLAQLLLQITLTPLLTCTHTRLVLRKGQARPSIHLTSTALLADVVANLMLSVSSQSLERPLVTDWMARADNHVEC